MDRQMRKLFLRNNNQITAGGAFFYRINNETRDLEFLLINSGGLYEDFGGRVDMNDKTIKSTVAREVEEESNKIFKRNEIIPLLRNQNSLYFRYSKYLVYLVQITERYDPSIFGNKEFHDNIDRTVEWIPYSRYRSPEFIRNNLSFRLKFKELFDLLAQRYSDAFGIPVPETMSTQQSIALLSPKVDNLFACLDENDNDTEVEPIFIKQKTCNISARA